VYTWVFIYKNQSYTVRTETDNKYEALAKLAVHVFELEPTWTRRIQKAVGQMDAYLEKGPLLA